MDKTTRIRRLEVEGVLSLLSFGLLISYAACENFHDPALIGNLRRGLADSAPGGDVFDVTKFGAVPGEKNNVQAFMKTWVAACKEAAGAARIVIPAGSFLVGPVVWQGPCKGPIVVEVHGTVKGTTDVSEYSSPEWFSFEEIDGLVITGSGTFDGQGPKVWKYNDCKTNPDCQHLAASFKFSKVKNAVIEGITSLDSKWFHFFVYRGNNFTFQDVRVVAPDESPNTDGIHLSSTTGVKILHTSIKTGDDCVAIVQDTHDIVVDNVTCGPGHGISIGSLGKYPDDKGSTGIVVKNCVINGASNGARIKTWAGPTSGEASNIVFENIEMKDVKNPIIIDQNYGKYKDQPSKWKLSDIHFRKIKGTSTSKVSVSLGCSSLNPCDTIEMADIDLTFKGAETESVCANAKVKQGGIVKPVPCSGSGKVESGE